MLAITKLIAKNKKKSVTTIKCLKTKLKAAENAKEKKKALS